MLSLCVMSLVLFHFALLFFFFLSFSLVYQCLSGVQIKNHILLPSTYCGVLYFLCVLKYNHAMFEKKKEKEKPEASKDKEIRLSCETGIFTMSLNTSRGSLKVHRGLCLTW